MKAIITNLTTSGNSVAVRLPKELLKMSGLSGRVTLEAKKGKIIIAKPDDARAGWVDQIDAGIADSGDPTYEFNDMNLVVHDGLDGLPWDGPSYEEWLKSQNGK